MNKNTGHSDSDSRIINLLIRGIIRLAQQKEFYGHIIQQFQKVYVKDGHPVTTAAVGRLPGERFIKMWLNLGFFGKVMAKYGEKVGWTMVVNVEEHEITHICLGHLFLVFSDKERGAVAKDCVVNGMMNPGDASNFFPFGYVHPKQFGLPTGKSAIWYYHELAKNKTFQEMSQRGDFSSGGALYSVVESHKPWEGVEEDEIAKEFVKDIVRASRDLCGGQYGNIPGGVVEQIEGWLKREKPRVRWNSVLRLFASSSSESVLDYTTKRLSRRFGTRPGTRKGDALRLAVGIDTSGSVSDELLRRFWNEVLWIKRNCAEVWIYECDTELSRRSPFSFGGRWDGKVHGRGGTSLEPVLRAAEGRYDALVYLTDFDAPPVSRRYRIPVLWVLPRPHAGKPPYPWGRVVVMDAGKDAA